MSCISRVREDIANVRAIDPAARSAATVFFLYSGVHAVWWYRISNRLWRWRWLFVSRAVSQFARWLTGIEIHPGATIGRRLFIDHGMGVVIGETAVIGDDVTLYHGVTLGGTSMLDAKRHPTLGSRVIVGAGAQVLGDITIGDDSKIGANAVVVKSALAGSVLVGIPAKPLVSKKSQPRKAQPKKAKSTNKP